MAGKRISRMILVAIMVAVFTLCAGAAPVAVQFVGLGGENQNGEYTYPYYLTINHGAWIPMACDDFYHGSAVGDAWLGNITPVTNSDLSNTRFGDAQLYDEAAFLVLQLTPANQPEWGNINFAIWQIFNPGVDAGTPPSGTLGASYWLDLAQNADLSNVNLSSVMILTPLDAHSLAGDQEFLFTTPEPGTLLLSGAALLGLFSQRKRFL